MTKLTLKTIIAAAVMALASAAPPQPCLRTPPG